MKFYPLLIILLFGACADKKQIKVQRSDNSKSVANIFLDKKYLNNLCVTDTMSSTNDLSTSYIQENLEEFYALKTAIYNNQLDIIKNAIEKKFPINITNQGQSLISVSANWGKIEIFDYLMSQGADINLLVGDEESGYSHPLSYASFTDNKELIKHAIDLYSNKIDNLESLKDSIFYHSVNWGSTNTLSYLLNELNYPSTNENIIFTATISLNTNILDFLYNNGFTNINITNDQGFTPLSYLHYYIEKGLINDYTTEMLQDTENWLKDKSSL
ncbi:MAG: hypothetical protein ACRCV0_04480 [Brevinema sp.]